MSNAAWLLGSPESAVTLVGVLVERLGGHVKLTESEINSAVLNKSKSLYMEVTAEGVTLEVVPGGADG